MEERTYLKGILGGIIGGIIGSLPWIICYVFANYMLSVFAFLIPLAAAKGYQIAKGKIDKKFTWILLALTIIIVSLAMFVIIPLIYIAKEGYGIDFELLHFILFETDYVVSGITDLLFAYGFSIAGAVTYGVNAANSLKKANQENVRFTVSTNELFSDSDSVKNFFVSRSALAPGFEVPAADTLELDQRTIGYLINNNVIKVSDNGYYFDLDSYEKLSASPNKQKGFAKKFLKIILIALAVIGVLFIVLCFVIGGDTKNVTFDQFTFEIPDDYSADIYDDYPDEMYIYLTEDENWDLGYAVVYEFDATYSAQEDKEAMDEYFAGYEGLHSIDSQLLVNKNDKEYVRYVMTFDDDSYYLYDYVYDEELGLAIEIWTPINNTKVCEDLKIIAETAKR